MATLKERAEQLIAMADQEHPRQSWRPDKESPNPLVGTVTGYSHAENQYGQQRILNVNDLDGQEWSVWLVQSALKSAIERHNPQPGALIVMKYLGKKISASSGRQYHSYNVCVEDSDQVKLQPPAVADEPTEPSSEDSVHAALQPRQSSSSSDDEIPF